MPGLERTHVPGIEPSYRGKVRDIYDLGETLLFIATDRVSAYDVVLPQPIPERGCILTVLSAFWFVELGGRVANHLISLAADDLPEPFATAARDWGPRFMQVDKLDMIPIECVVRGYLAGSGWKEYSRTGTVCGHRLPPGLPESAELETPIFTPATKAQEGHDINITKAQAAEIVGQSQIDELERLSLEIYEIGRTTARERGVILADTKFEFGLLDGELRLADEVLTPDSSRYWPLDEYAPGGAQPSFDKQFVRDYLGSRGWRGDGPPPDLPPEVVEGTADRYREIYRRLTGSEWTGS